jgi:HPr kinase/phosphorylase
VTAGDAENIRSQYLWVDAHVTGTAVPEVRVVEHKIASPWSANHRVDAHVVPSESVPGRWDATIRSTIDATRENLVGLDGLQAAESIYRTVHRDVMTAARIDQWTRLHAALVDCGGVRVAIAGHSGAGKTTLSLALALRGAQLHADEGVFIRGEEAVGLPRRVHVKAGTFDVLPEISSRELLHLPYKPPVWALDPTSLPTPPDVVAGLRGIDVLLILEGWSDTTRVEPMPTAVALKSLAEQSALWSDNHRLTLRNIAALLSNTACFSLTRQHLDSGIAAVEELVASCVTRSI